VATYRDSIHDPYNDAGGDAAFRIQFYSRLFSTVEAAVRGGLTPEEVVGIVAIYAVEAGPCPDSVSSSLLDAVSEYLAEAKEAGVSTPEAVGFILTSVQDAACRVSLSLRFEPRPSAG